MPYKCEGKNLMHQKNGKWSIKQHCSSEENCKKAMGLLEGLESGSIKKSEVGKKKETAQIKKLRKVI
jgi:hypothetical protein